MCGENWIRCLDFTGRFISQTTGDPVMTPYFFQIAEQIQLPDSIVDARWNPATVPVGREINAMRPRAESAMRNCQNDANDAWDFFLRQAVIEIAQEQDNIVRDMKDNCIDAIAQCYDARDVSRLGDIGGTQTAATMTAALAAAATSQMCHERVLMCARLFEPPDGDGADGLRILFSFVGSLDNARIEGACRDAVRARMDLICNAPATPVAGRDPWIACSQQPIGQIVNTINSWAADHCVAGAHTELDGILTRNTTPGFYGWDFSGDHSVVGVLMYDLVHRLEMSLSVGCGEDGSAGVWMDASVPIDRDEVYEPWLRTAFGGQMPPVRDGQLTDFGWCGDQSSERLECVIMDEESGGQGLAVWNRQTRQCNINPAFWEQLCIRTIGGAWHQDQCIIRG